MFIVSGGAVGIAARGVRARAKTPVDSIRDRDPRREIGSKRSLLPSQTVM
ncbi:hypothetical protein [Halalkalicoccus subterraneus]|nr:hypothetical protein [Halalkalicoccus subterraneus]